MLRIREVAQPNAAAAGVPRLSTAAASAEIVRDFADPYLELVRLLREAAEIEHALMVQYLYGAYSLKPTYVGVRGFSAPSPNHLLGVAIQEMQHLEKVNRMLGELGSAPNLIRQGFPYEPDIYPFPLNLEPLSRVTLAKYVYTEAPAGKLDRDNPDNAEPDAQAFLDRLDAALGDVRPNHVGSLYQAIIDRTNDVIAAALPGLPDLSAWPDRMSAIKGEGESDHGHFGFFRSVFLGTHAGFGGHPDPWALPPDHPDYPAVDLGTNPSALDGNPNTISTDGGRRRLAWLSDLHYWIILALLDLGYRSGLPAASARAKRHMTSALAALGAHLATLGVGLPFDPLSAGYALGRDTPTTVRVLRALVREAENVTAEVHDLLPNGFPTTLTTDTLAALDQMAPENDGVGGGAGGGGGGPVDQVATDFWFTYDDHFLFNPPPQVIAAYAALGDIDGPLTQFTQTRAAGTFPAAFRTAVEPLRAGLTALSTEQLAIVDQFYAADDAALQGAFEHFGCGDLFDDRRPPGNKVHMMDSSGPANPPIGYHRWHASIRAMTELGIDADRWNTIDRFVALAWAIHAETQPTQDAHNSPVVAQRLIALRNNWLNRTPDELDDAFDAFPFPAVTP